MANDNQILREYCLDVAQRAKAASALLAVARGNNKNNWLRQSAEELRRQIGGLLAANRKDLAAAPGYGLTEAQIDRLRLTPARIDDIAVGLEEVAACRIRWAR